MADEEYTSQSDYGDEWGSAADYLEGTWSSPEYRLKNNDGSVYYPKDDAGHTQETWYGGADYFKEWPSGPSTGGTSYTDMSPWGATAAASKASGLANPKSTTTKAASSSSSAKAAPKASYAQLQPLKTGGYSVSTTETIAPSGPSPTYGEIPDFLTPEWNEREINRMAQQKAAPGVRKLRTAIQQAQSRTYENPNVGRMTLRDALAGYGLGLEGVMAGAQSSALGEYGRKYQTQYEGAAAKYSADRQAQAAVFNAAWQNYLKQYTTKTSQEEHYDYDIVNATPEMGFTKSSLGQLPTQNPTGYTTDDLLRRNVNTFGTGY